MSQLTNSLRRGELPRLVPLATQADTSTEVFPHCLSSTAFSCPEIEVWQLCIPESTERACSASPQAVIKNTEQPAQNKPDIYNAKGLHTSLPTSLLSLKHRLCTKNQWNVAYNYLFKRSFKSKRGTQSLHECRAHRL